MLHCIFSEFPAVALYELLIYRTKLRNSKHHTLRCYQPNSYQMSKGVLKISCPDPECKSQSFTKEVTVCNLISSFLWLNLLFLEFADGWNRILRLICKKAPWSSMTCASPRSHAQTLSSLTFWLMELPWILICSMTAPTARDGKKVLWMQVSIVFNHYSLWIFPPQPHENQLLCPAKLSGRRPKNIKFLATLFTHIAE